MDNLIKAIEELVSKSKEVLDLSEEIKRDVLKINDQDELTEDSGQSEKERDDFHAGQAESRGNNGWE